MPRVSAHRTGLVVLALSALGVVFGDIGTSPLYAVQAVFALDDGLIKPTTGNVYGVISLMFWSVTLIVSIKYVSVVMRADNDGEGGVMALAALVRQVLDTPRGRAGAAMLIGVLGAALFYGDSLITPAISILSAVEGVEVAAPGLKHVVLPAAIVVLIGLFAVQKWGTGRVGALFGPIMVLWFGLLAAAGIGEIARKPDALAALSPTYGFAFLVEHPHIGFIAMGAVVLVITGAEALYADMGHFGRRSVALAWFSIAFPALVLNYLGQGVLVLRRPDTLANPFFHLFPSWAQWPMVVIATAATVIASQAVISGAFSMTRQAIQLGFMPAMTVKQTSKHEGGQIYLPAVNAFLFVGVLILMVSFDSSVKLATAYGVAVTGTLLITTALLLVLARIAWQWPAWKIALAGVMFGGLEGVFFIANIAKIAHGGWLPLLIASLILLIMTTWHQGRSVVTANRTATEGNLAAFIDDIHKRNIPRVPGTAVFLHPGKDTTPLALRANLHHNGVLHAHVIIVSAQAENTPFVSLESSMTVDDLRYSNDGIYHLNARFGFAETPDVPQAVARAVSAGLLGDGIDVDQASYFVSRASLRMRPGGMVRWRKLLFVTLARNAADPAVYFNLPPDRTVFLGNQVEL